jgi:hypothetical protein
MFDIFFGNFKHFLGNLSLLTKISLQLYRFEVITCQTFVLSKIYLCLTIIFSNLCQKNEIRTGDGRNFGILKIGIRTSSVVPRVCSYIHCEN